MFSLFMHNYLAQVNVKPNKELFVGDVILAAIRQGLCVESVSFAQGRYIDIGTPDDLVRAVAGSWA